MRCKRLCAIGPSLRAFVTVRIPREIDQAVKAFRAYAAKGKETAGGYLMDHSRIAYLMGPDGQPIEMLPVDKGADAVLADLKLSVK